MTFDELLAQVLELLQREKRLSYRALTVRFGLDDEHLEALKDEIIEAKQLAVDDKGRVLVWAGDTATAALPAAAPAHAPLAAIPAYLAEKIRTAGGALAGERKQVTVLFADLKDSTELIRGLDPEAAQQLLDPALHRMMDAVHRFEGTVNQVLGDGIMALFGAPIAHEDHDLRACYAALAMQASTRAYTAEVRRTHGLEMRIRVGLNSGEVVVRTIGNDLHMDYSAVGETTHLAARMEQLATPGSVCLTAATLLLVEGLIQVNTLGPVPVKGVAEPVEVFELVGASSTRRRLQAAAARADAVCWPADGARRPHGRPGAGWSRTWPGGGGRPQGMDAEAGDHVGEAELAGIALHDVPIHRCRVQGLGQDSGAVVFDRPEQRAVQVLAMPGGLQVGGNEPLRQDMQRQVAHLVPFPFHAQMRHAFPLLDVPHFERAQLLAPEPVIQQGGQDGAARFPLSVSADGASRSIRAW